MATVKDTQRFRATDSHLGWPFFSGHHSDVQAQAERWAQSNKALFAHPKDSEELDKRCRAIVASLGESGLLQVCVGSKDDFDARAICLCREVLAYHCGLADFAFAMQGLGSGAVSLFGNDEQAKRWLKPVAKGEKIAAFALSEPDAGSDVASMQCTARRDGDDYVLNGNKTWISNGGIADFYIVFARTSPADIKADGSSSASGISAFVVEAGTPGFSIAERIDVIAPHPLATLDFSDCRVPAANRVGEEGRGFAVAMATLDVFRSSVAAAAIGFARRALDEALAHAGERAMFGKHLADFQMTQATLAEMDTAIESSALLTYRAAWLRDQGGNVTGPAAKAKLVATESAQQVIDKAVQLFGGRGVKTGEKVEELYREIRALRIYEGASEVQKLIIFRELVKQQSRGDIGIRGDKQ